MSPAKVRFSRRRQDHEKKVCWCDGSGIGWNICERAQDVAILGKGKIHKLNDTTLSGIGTQFTRDVRPRDTVVIYMSKADGSRSNVVLAKLRVVTVKNDTELEVKNPSKDVKSINESQHSFKVFPHIDQSEVFRNVCDKLVKGHAVGIFRGGSHDRTSLFHSQGGCFDYGTLCDLSEWNAHYGDSSWNKLFQRPSLSISCFCRYWCSDQANT